MAGNFFDGEFFGGAFFGASVDSGHTSGGKGDNERRARRVPFKPTGLLERPRNPSKEGRKEVADRVDESRQIEAEIAEKLAREFKEDTLRLPAEQPPVAEMSLKEVEQEIGAILRKKIRTEEDEVILLMLMAAGAT